MKIKYLETAAAEGIPALYCDCDTCTEARKRGGRNIRTRSQAIIDGKLMIDYPADTYMHVLGNNINLLDIEAYILTHGHSDHVYPDDVLNRFPGYSNQKNGEPIRFYGAKGAIERIENYLKPQSDEYGKYIKTEILPFYKPVKIGEYTVTALEAWHGTAEPAIYLITDSKGKTLLYAHDTNYFKEEVWNYLEKEEIYLDFVSLDCTEANAPKMAYKGHMNLNDNIKAADRLKKIGCADEKTVFCCNHFSHNGVGVLYEEFSKTAAEKGFITSYDGMEVEF